MSNNVHISARTRLLILVLGAVIALASVLIAAVATGVLVDGGAEPDLAPLLMPDDTLDSRSRDLH